MHNDNQSIRVVIADDHPVFRDGIRFMVQKQKKNKIKIIGEAGDGSELIQEVEKLKPDIVITDILMPGMNGIEATKTIQTKFPATKVIAISMCEEKEIVYDMFKAGALSYLLKNAPREEILHTIEVVYSNSLYFANHSSRVFFEKFILGNTNLGKSPIEVRLTEKEIQIMRLICNQYSTKQMAASLGISTRTVEDTRYRIQDKINVHCAVGIALYAVKYGFVKWEEIKGV